MPKIGVYHFARIQSLFNRSRTALPPYDKFQRGAHEHATVSGLVMNRRQCWIVKKVFSIRLLADNTVDIVHHMICSLYLYIAYILAQLKINQKPQKENTTVSLVFYAVLSEWLWLYWLVHLSSLYFFLPLLTIDIFTSCLVMPAACSKSPVCWRR